MSANSRCGTCGGPLSEASPQADQPASASAPPEVGPRGRPTSGPHLTSTALVLREFARRAVDWLRPRPDGYAMPWSLVHLREHLLAGAMACEALQGSRDQRVDLERRIRDLEEAIRDALPHVPYRVEQDLRATLDQEGGR